MDQWERDLLESEALSYKYGQQRQRGVRTTSDSDSEWLDDQLLRRQHAKQSAQQVLPDALKFALVAAIHQGLVRAYSEVLKGFGQYVDTLVPSATERAEIHRRVGEMAQRSVLSAYGQRVTGNQSAMSRTHYRAGAGRMAGGLLRKALNNPAMIDASPDHLAFVNWGLLDQEASHWYRLNFGVGARGRGSRQGRFEMLFEGKPSGQPIGFNTGPSVNPLILPRGFFLDSGGGRQRRDASRRGMDAFYPLGTTAGMGIKGRPLQTRVSRGIEARNFLDAGVARIAKELPKAYDDWYRNKAAQLSGKTRAEIDAEVPRLNLSFREVAPRRSNAEKRYRKGAPL